MSLAPGKLGPFRVPVSKLWRYEPPPQLQHKRAASTAPTEGGREEGPLVSARPTSWPTTGTKLHELPQI